MPNAHLLIRHEPHYRRDAFESGLKRCGFTIQGHPRGAIGPGDVLVIWNRYGHYHELARRFEAGGGRVIVAENGPLGREWRGEHWYSIVEGNPAGGGRWPDLGASRWDSLNVDICEWRKGGREVIILAQRGIGPPGIAQPNGWAHAAAARFNLSALGPVRIREHPGEGECVALDVDLRDALCVVTWASGAALKALLMGIPVIYGYEKWLGRAAASPVRVFSAADAARMPQSLHRERLPVFRDLASTMWLIPEIASGKPFSALLGAASPSGTSATITARA